MPDVGMLAPNAPDWTPPPQAAADVLSGTPGVMPTETTPPVTVTTGAPGDVNPVAMAQQMLQPDAAPAYQQPTMEPDHEAWWRRALDTVGTIMGGDQTIHITKDPQGNVSVTHDPSTTGEKWGRVAAAALSGAAKGLAAGQGPGGAAKAIAAGYQQGSQQTQQQLDAANTQAANMNQQMLAKANHALLDQRIMAAQFANKTAPITFSQQQSEFALNMATKLQDAGAKKIATVRNPKELADFGSTNPNAVAAHSGASDDVIVPIPQQDGSTDMWLIPANVAKQMNPNAHTQHVAVLDPDNPGKVLWQDHTEQGNTKSYGAQALADKALIDQNNKTIATAQERGTSAKEAETKANEATNKQPLVRAQTAAENANARLHGNQASLLEGGKNAATAGLTGDAYLQAAVDPSQWNQIRAAANGDVKMPTASRSPANQVFRNAVMNYDPTFTDARYETKQNFKTKGDATSILQLSTAMAHADRALTNSAKLGNSPSLLSGRNLSGTAAAYNTDANFFTGEAGKLAMGGIIGEKEAERIRNQISSPIQSTRDDALHEVLRLTSGKVGGLVQKYKTGAQQELPVQEFFDQPTQDLLTRYGIVKAPGGGGPSSVVTNPPPAQAFTPKTPPAGQQKPGYAYGVGPKGEGWYKQ